MAQVRRDLTFILGEQPDTLVGVVSHREHESRVLRLHELLRRRVHGAKEEKHELQSAYTRYSRLRTSQLDVLFHSYLIEFDAQMESLRRPEKVQTSHFRMMVTPSTLRETKQLLEMSYVFANVFSTQDDRQKRLVKLNARYDSLMAQYTKNF